MFREVNEYRVANKMPALRSSPSLNIVANRHLLDLRQNLKILTHSWSNCAYDLKDQKTWTCVHDAPRRLNSGYQGKGYETLFRTTSGNVSTKAALDAWRKSSLHKSIILNQGSFKDVKWDELGVAIDGPFAVLWFGTPGRPAVAIAGTEGLGVSLEKVTDGLKGLVSIAPISTTINSQTWQGYSADRKIRIDLNGTKEDLTMADLILAVKLDPDKQLNATHRKVLGTLLKNIFPEWPEIDVWLQASANAIARDRSASKQRSFERY